MRVLALAAGCLLIAGCAAPSGVSLSSREAPRVQTPPVDFDPCSRTYQTTVLADRLIVGVAAPLAEPYFVDEDPSSGAGYEAALVYGIAAELGLPETAVMWETVPADAVPTEVDLIIDRRTPSPRPGVVYTIPYLQAPATLVVAESTVLGRALDGLRVGTVTDTVQGLDDARSFPTVARAKRALRNGSVDVLALAPADAAGVGIVRGQTWEGTSPIGFAMAAGNPLLTCVDAAITDMGVRGDLQRLAQEWFEPDARITAQ